MPKKYIGRRRVPVTPYLTSRQIVDAWHRDMWRLVDHGTPIATAWRLAQIDLCDRVQAKRVAA